jgi:hypothetical protein
MLTFKSAKMFDQDFKEERAVDVVKGEDPEIDRLWAKANR